MPDQGAPTPDPTSGPFRVRDSELTAKRLRSPTLDGAVWGVRAPLGYSADLRGRCELLALRLGSGVVFSHTTAALLLGAPLPLTVERRPEVHVAVAAPASTPHARGLVGHRLALSSQDVVVIRGLRLTSPARTWCDLASVLALDDLVAAGDYLIHHRAAMTSRAEIDARLAEMGSVRGIRLARQALPLLSDRPESPQESKLRLILIRGGLPEPEINHTLVGTVTGKEVRPDFRFRKFKLIIEYLGDYHRTKRQWRKDMTRRSRLEAQGWYVMEINADDLLDPDELVARIRTVLSRRS